MSVVMHQGTEPDLDALLLMCRDLDRAFVGAGIVERFFAFGDHVARLRFAGDALVEPLTRAIAHLACDESDEATLTIDVWDSVSTGVALSPLLTALVDAVHGNPFALLTPRHELKALTNARVAATYELGSGVFTLYDRSTNHAIYWVRDPDALPYYELGAPFRTTLNWWLSGRGVQCIHAAAVGREDGALLLTGKGGSGKSTTALACITSPLKYLGDDYCAFSIDGRPEVFSLYNTGKLRDDVDVQRQPHFAPWIVNPDRERDEKYLMFLAEHARDRILSRAPLAAIVLPRVTGAIRPRLTAVSPALALKSLAPTSMFQLPGSSRGAFEQMAALSRTMPCYSLECGADLAATTSVLAGLLAELIPCEPRR